LRCDDDIVLEHLAEERREQTPPLDGARRNRRAREHERNASCRTLTEQIWPQLFFDDDRKARLNAIEKASNAAGRIERQKAHVHDITEHFSRARSAGTGRRRQRERHVGVTVSQGAHECGRRLNLTH
jgi:hypothetical protein